MRFFYTIFLILSLSSCSQNMDELDQAKKAIQESYPNLPIENIKKIDESLFEVVIQGEIFYLSADLKYFFAGNIIDVKTVASNLINTYDIMNSNQLIITREAFKSIEEIWDLNIKKKGDKDED